ncbi:hypothetical protein OESDEN_18152 [Oesophagostomum dentatum]|uniref:glucuronosyltransferase n=1 Tax=Oesophagostomum dentatum TaxID=61180 RepID=A0A0B1SE73_OESDE|nr:hypothetical protein OESDEN_18152 [Oesophagostomum dentatum]
MLERHGGCIVLTKSDLESPNKLKTSLQKIFSDASYAQNARRLADMLHDQPISAKQLFIRHSEFTARFGRLPNLDPYGRQLSFIQYYLIDILMVLSTIIIFSFYIMFRLLRKCFSISLKVKKE